MELILNSLTKVIQTKILLELQILLQHFTASLRKISLFQITKCRILLKTKWKRWWDCNRIKQLGSYKDFNRNQLWCRDLSVKSSKTNLVFFLPKTSPVLQCLQISTKGLKTIFILNSSCKWTERNSFQISLTNKKGNKQFKIKFLSNQRLNNTEKTTQLLFNEVISYNKK